MAHLYAMVLFIFAVFLVNDNVLAEVYQWVDEAGEIHFSNKKHDAGENARKIELNPINTFTRPPLIQRLPSEKKKGSDQDFSGMEVLIYTTQRCGFCRSAKAYMDKQNIHYTEIDIERSETGLKQFERLGGKAFPY